MRFEIAADTDRGIVKETNQDSLLLYYRALLFAC